MFVHKVHSANLLLNQFEQALHNGQVLDDVWTDLLDKDEPLAEVVERAEGTSWMRKVLVNDVQENESESSRRQRRLQLKSNQTRTCSRFRKRKATSQGGTTDMETAARAIISGKASGSSGSHGCSNLHPPVFENDVFHAGMDVAAFVNTV